jgi:hypothetical protein
MGFFHTQPAGAVGYEHANFLEGSGVEQLFNTLTGGQLVLGVLCGNARFPAAQAGFRADFFQWIGYIFHIVQFASMIL